ncbi:MAG TPA: CoA transferase [Dehalococcoidia bacterium]|nr:CoA transferase [Dehalococcoidia bacterium]
MANTAQKAGQRDRSVAAPLPLAGLRVLDLATVLAGPFAATELADFGADVIKVEIPGRGDTLRTLGPVQGDTSYWWATESRNKRGITLDLRKDAGKALLLRLCAVSDVLVENFVPGTLEGWELGPEVLQGANPRLVIVRVSGFGQTGPYRRRPGYDRIGAAFGGLWHLTGHPESEPVRPGLSVVDYMTGMLSTIGALIALYARDAGGSGRGQIVDTALYESVVRALEFTAAHFSSTGVVRQPVGNGGPATPSGAYRTKDERWVMLIAADLRQFQRLMLAIDRPDLADDARFKTNAARTEHRDEINDAIAVFARGHEVAEIMQRLERADIPMTASYNVADLFADPHVAERDVLVDVEDPQLGPLRMQGVVPKLSQTPGRVRRPAPTLGQHNAEVFGGLLGIENEELAALKREGVV